MGKASRDKGKRGQREFRNLLTERDFTFMESRAGAEEEDLLAISPEGKVFSVEVKNCININQTAFLTQAKRQAAARGKGTAWMLACSIHGKGNTFLVQTQDSCQIWRGNGVTHE